MTACNVCNAPTEAPIYSSPCERSVTTMCEVLPHGIRVYFCQCCGHLQTNPLGDLVAYYNEEYKILADSEDEDQLYDLGSDGRKIFRTEHQVRTLLSKISIPENARVLDYGCAKASTLRKLLTHRPDLVPHCFDVSDLYLPFWEQFVPKTHQSTHALKPGWSRSFDLITSFFALEHVGEPRQFVGTISGLLKPGGLFYCLVPNVYANSGDFIVADHVSHFSRPSLLRLLSDAGMTPVSIDDTAHASAWVIVAQKSPSPVVSNRSQAAEEVMAVAVEALRMSAYWREFGGRVETFERDHFDCGAVAIYGSGFYGTCIASSLRAPEKVVCFLDRNPYRQKQTLMGKKILSPESLPVGVSLLYVGLNPKIARETIQPARLWPGRQLTCFYP